MKKTFGSGYYTYLLFFLILIYAFRPYDIGIIYLGVWKACFTCTLLTAIFNCKHKPKVKNLAMALAIPTLAFTWLELFYASPWLLVANISFTVLFLIVCTASVLYDVILYAKVTVETLRGVVCAYFMIAFLFAYAYYLVEFLSPGAFRLIFHDVSFTTYSRALSQMLYFSFTTLLTIGFGDITPLTDISQTLVVLEGIVGQFYVAILVARIVSVYSLFSDKKMIKKIENDLRNHK